MTKIRTRFAPSPTGRMHVGNLRTALYAYLITKHEGGDFILRIEDTDQERYVEGAVDIIYRTMEKTGLIHDEGPDKDGGYGPYVQSERQAQGIYMKYARQLVDQGDAYYCFCQKEELESMKRVVAGKEISAFCRGDCFDLFLIESFQYIHISLRTDILISLYNRRKYLSAQCDGGDACHGNDDAQDLPRGDLFSVKEGPHDHEGEDDEAVRHDEGGIDGPACLVHVDVPKLDADDGSAKTEGRRIDGEDVLLPSCFPCPLDEVNGKGNGGCDEVGHDERDEGIHTGRDFLQPDLVSDT